ncbi:MAG: hypothetical protein J7J86_10425, partial [Bacteroidales bacterium]|nr:hypothetical protein [Bacteroidales bacterium]
GTFWINIYISDVMQIHVRQSKGRKGRYFILSEKALMILREYYKKERPSEYLFEGLFGGKYSASSFRNVLAKSTKSRSKQKRFIPRITAYFCNSFALSRG